MVDRVKVEKKRKGNPLFVKGHRLSVGNKGYTLADRQVKRFITAAYIHQLQQMDPKKKTSAVERMVRKQIKAAEAGSLKAVKEITDRVEGRAAQAIVIEGGKNPVKIISGEMTPQEAAAAYAATLTDSDPD